MRRVVPNAKAAAIKKLSVMADEGVFFFQAVMLGEMVDVTKLVKAAISPRVRRRASKKKARR